MEEDGIDAEPGPGPPGLGDPENAVYCCLCVLDDVKDTFLKARPRLIICDSPTSKFSYTLNYRQQDTRR